MDTVDERRLYKAYESLSSVPTGFSFRRYAVDETDGDPVLVARECLRNAFHSPLYHRRSCVSWTANCLIIHHVCTITR